MLKALVVIESAGTRNLISTILEGMDFTVDIVSDGQAAYVLLSSLMLGRYDIVFLDTQMEDWNGMDILGFHEERKGRKNIVVISEDTIVFESDIRDHPNVLRIMAAPIRSGDIVGVVTPFIQE